ncbi:hypothetical protein GQ53DRAFT_755508 [Thozetella sp. PMI_491]|nr:hypothetical protein GQ53DRAFT_755508 [Thozetella sp. PMI_491]
MELPPRPSPSQPVPGSGRVLTPLPLPLNRHGSGAGRSWLLGEQQANSPACEAVGCDLLPPPP